MPPSDARTTVVVITRDRCRSLLRTLERLTTLPERPPVLVVDNASTDGTASAVAARFPRVRVEALDRNVGAAGRTVGVRAAATPYVAFSDDDSWWAAGALSRAADHLDRHPDLAVIAARILVGPEELLDPASAFMARSPLPGPEAVGPAVLGFVACGAVVRREAYLQAGGFHPRYGVGGEEDLLAMELAARGWRLAFAADVVAHHHPDGDRSGRTARLLRNELWTAWLRRAPRSALRRTLRALRLAASDPAARSGVIEAVTGAGWVAAERRPVPRSLERSLRAIEAAASVSGGAR